MPWTADSKRRSWNSRPGVYASELYAPASGLSLASVSSMVPPCGPRVAVNRAHSPPQVPDGHSAGCPMAVTGRGQLLEQEDGGEASSRIHSIVGSLSKPLLRPCYWRGTGNKGRKGPGCALRSLPGREAIREASPGLGRPRGHPLPPLDSSHSVPPSSILGLISGL